MCRRTVAFVLFVLSAIAGKAQTQPDLKVDRIEIIPASPITQGTGVTVKVHWSNAGVATPTNRQFFLHAEINPSFSGNTRDISYYNSAAGDTTAQTVFSNLVLPAGQYAISAKIDDTSTITESLENNNSRNAFFDVITPENNPPSVPSLLSPANGATVTTGAVDLDWSTSFDPEGNGVDYEVQVSTSTSFSSPVRSAAPGSSFWTVDPPLGNGTYYWRARALDYNDNASSWTGSRSFTVSVNAAPTLAMTAPSADVTVVQGASVRIAWDGTDPDNAALVAIAYDPDQNPSNGNQTTIASSQPEDGAVDWNTAGVALGTYSLIGTITDGNATATAYAPGRVTIVAGRSAAEEFVDDARIALEAARGQSIGAAYAAGKKHLLSFCASIVPKKGIDVSPCLVADLDDLAGVTAEGQQGWVTVWVDAGIGFAISPTARATSLGISVASIGRRTAEQPFDDPRRQASITPLTVNMTMLSLSALTYDGTRVEKLDATWVPSQNDVSIGFLTTTWNLARFEIHRAALLQALNPIVTASSVLNPANVALSLVNGIVPFNEYGHISSYTPFTAGNYRPFTSWDDPLVVDQNQLGIVNVFAGVDLNGDDRGDNYVPVSGSGSTPTVFYPLRVDFLSDSHVQRDLLIQAGPLPPGWTVEALDRFDDPAGSQYLVRADPGGIYGTYWRVGAAPSGANDVTIEFRLYENGFFSDTLIEPPTRVRLSKSSSRSRVPRADLDADRRTDVSIFRPLAGNWYVRNSSTGSVSLIANWGQGVNDVPVPGDYDGDGRLDAAVFRAAGGQWFIRRSSDGGTTYIPNFGLGANDRPVATDYDGDGRTDIAIFRPGSGEWFIRRSTDGGTTYIPSFGLGASDVPVPADYDGDGRSDIAVFRPGGEWFIRQSTDGGFVYIANFGMGGTDRPVPGDYDGDGRADVAVFRPGSGDWFARRSSNGATLYVPAWGRGASDIPVPGDWDGDGRFDPAVFRPITGEWFVRQSGNGATFYVPNFGPQSGDKPVPAFAR